jgi:hypothetical protein
MNVSAHVNKYYAKHRRRGDQESAAKTEEEKLEDQESQQVYKALQRAVYFRKKISTFWTIFFGFSLLFGNCSSQLPRLH